MNQAIFLPKKKSSSLIYETTRFFKHCFPKTAWTSFGYLLTNPIKWSVSKPSK